MAIYKSSDYGRSWTPFHYYSSKCRKLYGRPERGIVSRVNEQEPLCSDVASTTGGGGLMPGSGGARVAFVTLEGRPSAGEFDASPVLQDWVTATDVRVVFHRVSSDDDQEAADTGYYALSDFAVGGRCKCNGHAARCGPVATLPGGGGAGSRRRSSRTRQSRHRSGVEGGQLLACQCRHNTAGVDCERCKPFHYDRPWARATEQDANECIGKHRCGAFLCIFKITLARCHGIPPIILPFRTEQNRTEFIKHTCSLNG